MLEDFQFVGILGAITLTIPVVTLLIAWTLRPHKPHLVKQETYESGIATIGEAWVKFKAQYYIYAIIYVIFDIEAVFLLPFAVALDILPTYTLIWAIIFMVLLFDGLVYAWRKGALHWT